MKISKKQLVVLFGLYVVAILFLMLTNPQNLPLPLLIVPFIYAFVTLFITVKVIVGLFSDNKSLGNSVGLTVTIFIVLCLILASIRQLSSRDLLISLAITVLLSWYLIKIRKI